MNVVCLVKGHHWSPLLWERDLPGPGPAWCGDSPGSRWWAETSPAGCRTPPGPLGRAAGSGRRSAAACPSPPSGPPAGPWDCPPPPRAHGSGPAAVPPATCTRRKENRRQRGWSLRPQTGATERHATGGSRAGTQQQQQLHETHRGWTRVGGWEAGPRGWAGKQASLPLAGQGIKVQHSTPDLRPISPPFSSPHPSLLSTVCWSGVERLSPCQEISRNTFLRASFQ